MNDTRTTRTTVFGPDRGEAATRPNVAKDWLHRPTGTAGVTDVHTHHDGGPIATRGSGLFDALTPVPLPEHYPHDAGRTEADLEARLQECGWRPATRAQAATLLRLDGFPLGTNRGPGHLLYADQADATIWADHPSTRHDRETWVARDGAAQGTPTPACCAPARLGVATLDSHTSAAHLAALAVRRDGSTYLHTGRRMLGPVDPNSAAPTDREHPWSTASVDDALAQRGWFPVTRRQVTALLSAADANQEAYTLLRVARVDDATWRPSDRDLRLLRTLVAYRGTPTPAYDQRERSRPHGRPEGISATTCSRRSASTPSSPSRSKTTRCAG
jgi:hypothetical protein